jgi:hypothetical protein
MARKLACLFYRLLTKGQQYVGRGASYYSACKLFKQKHKPHETLQVISGECLRQNGPTASQRNSKGVRPTRRQVGSQLGSGERLHHRL